MSYCQDKILTFKIDVTVNLWNGKTLINNLETGFLI
jgi:hypothetical protein